MDQNQRRSAHRHPSSIRACARRLRSHAAAARGSLGRLARGSGTADADYIAVRSRYRLGELLGSGGLGEVFRATKLGAEGFERTVAVKRIRPELAQQERFVRLFIREAQVLSRLAHPNVVNAWGFDRDANGQLFLVMEYVDGVDLKKLIDSGPLPQPVVIFIVTEILNGLGHAHHLPDAEGALGVVHRDLSPHNVLLSWEGAVKVADFGLAKFQWSRHVSASFDLQGKVAFMSPEQAAHQPLDGRSDLFSVGVMLWEMLTGERLFAREHEDATTTKWRVLTDRIEPPGVFRPVAVDLGAVVMRLLDRDPAQRYPTAGAARAALIACEGASKLARQELERILVSRFPQAFARRALAVVQASAHEPRGRTQTAPPCNLPRARRRPRWAVLVVVVCVLATVGIGALVGFVATRIRSAAVVRATTSTSSDTAAPMTCPNAEQ